MKKPSRTSIKVMSAITTPIAIIAAGALIYQASYAAFSGQTRNSGNDWSTGTVAVSDDDAGVARFQVASMQPGDTQTKCIKVTANASVDGEVRGYAVNPVQSAQGLEDHIMITVKAGTGGTFADCTGFVSEETVVPTISLKQMFGANSYDSALGGWPVGPGNQSRTYEITWAFDTTGMTQTEIDRLQGAHTGVDFQWELQSV